VLSVSQKKGKRGELERNTQIQVVTEQGHKLSSSSRMVANSKYKVSRDNVQQHPDLDKNQTKPDSFPLPNVRKLEYMWIILCQQNILMTALELSVNWAINCTFGCIYIFAIFCYQGSQFQLYKGVEMVELTTGYEFIFPTFNVIQPFRFICQRLNSLCKMEKYCTFFFYLIIVMK